MNPISNNVLCLDVFDQVEENCVKNALSSYNVEAWGEQYFSINAEGHVTVALGDQSIALSTLASQLIVHGISLPAILRFPQIIQDRVACLYHAFEQAIKKHHYQNDYTLVYPIKVNQKKRVLKEVLDAQATKKRPALEVGTKAELMIALSSSPKETLIVCNGYKDQDYIRLALLAQQLGHSVHIVIEKPAETGLILETAEQLSMTPSLGVRIKLSTKAKSAWEMTSGEKAKFGLSASQLLHVVAVLKEHNALPCLRLLHVHLGSQLVNLADIEKALQECGRHYAELHRLGATVSTLDLGGGLAVDYEGLRSSSTYSMNYSVEDYADTIISCLSRIFRENNLPEPALMTESGRALVAHHAVLLTNVLDVDHSRPACIKSPEFDAPVLLHSLWKLYKAQPLVSDAPSVKKILGALTELMAQMQAQYRLGQLDLSQRAWAEKLCEAVYHRLDQGLFSGEDDALSNQLTEQIASHCHVNFSLFQSLPDAWGIDQIFPILPIVGLNQAPEQRLVISDMTCDSEGSIESYVTENTTKNTLLLPPWPTQEPKILAFFLVGAYQEVLGSQHNLLGETASVAVEIGENGELLFSDDKKGACIAEVLNSVGYSHEALVAGMLLKLKSRNLTAQQKNHIKQYFQQSLYGSSYLQGA